MPYELFFDTETSGLPLWRESYDHPRQPWVCQLAVVLSDADRIYQSLNLVIRADGRNIEPDAAATHGYTAALCDEVGIPERHAISLFYALARRASLFVCHNVDFDRLMVMGMMHRHTQPSFIEQFANVPAYCTMKNTTDLCKLPGNYDRYKWPKLQELHTHLFGIEFTDAHDALADVMATRKCFYELRERGHVTSAQEVTDGTQS